MSELEKLRVVTKYEFLKQVRRRRFYGFLAMTLLAVGLTAALYQSLNLPERMRTELKKRMGENIPETMKDSLLDQAGMKDSPEFFALWVSSMGALALIGAVFFGGDSIASEFEHRTGYLLFPNPVKRSTLVIGKYLACFLAAVAVLAIGYAFSAINLLVFYQTIPIGLPKSLGVAIALTCFMVSFAFVFSALMKGGMGATVAALLSYMAIFPIISMALSATGHDPWFMPDRAGDAIGATYDISYESLSEVFGGEGGSMRGVARASQDPLRASLVLVGYALVLLLLSVQLTLRREMV